ncbi:MAG: hypothetical protein U0694_09115 [Anaerolineae bacterium]
MSYGNGNFPAIAEETLGVHQGQQQLQVKGGIMIASILRANEVETISTLPSLDEMRAQLAGLIVTPASTLWASSTRQRVRWSTCCIHMSKIAAATVQPKRTVGFRPLFNPTHIRKQNTVRKGVKNHG